MSNNLPLLLFTPTPHLYTILYYSRHHLYTALYYSYNRPSMSSIQSVACSVAAQVAARAAAATAPADLPALVLEVLQEHERRIRSAFADTVAAAVDVLVRCVFNISLWFRTCPFCVAWLNCLGGRERGEVAELGTSAVSLPPRTIPSLSLSLSLSLSSVVWCCRWIMPPPPS